MGAACQVCDGALLPYRHAWLSRCDGCSVLSADLAIDIPGEVATTGVDEALRASGLHALRRRNNAALLKGLSRLVPTRGRPLDVGSGPGFLLAQAETAGFHAEGLEPDANVVTRSRAKRRPRPPGLFPG
jgi:hypothetical protein